MAGEYPFGIDDAKVTARNAAGVLSATKVDVLGVSALSFGIESDSVEHRGDNEAKRIRKSGKKVTGTLEAAATVLAVLAATSDGAVVSSGVSPNVITTYTEPGNSVGLAYQIEAQAADGAGAQRVTILNATTTGGPTFDWAEGEFTNPSIDYEGTPFSGNLFKIEQYETAAAIV